MQWPRGTGLVPPTALDFVRTLVALKVRQPPSAVATTRSIKDFAAGKSTGRGAAAARNVSTAGNHGRQLLTAFDCV